MLLSSRQKTLIVLSTLCILTLCAVVVLIVQEQKSKAYDIDTSVPLVQAIPADSLVDTIGMNIHVTWWDQPTMEQDYAAMTDLGIRYLRDGTGVPYATALAQGNPWIAALQHYKQLGISTDSIFDINLPPTDVTQYINAANSVTPGTIYAAEGPDEADFGCYPDATVYSGTIWQQCNPDTLWIAPTQNAISAMQTALRADPTTHNLPLYSIAIGASHYGVTNAILGGGSDTHYYGNLHYYPIYTTPWLTDSLANQINDSKQLYGDKPKVITEVGYPDQSLSPTQQVDSSLQADVVPAYFLAARQLGLDKLFLYELQDPGGPWPNERFGLMTVDGVKKPAYTAVKNLISTFSDPGTSFTPGKLRYEVDGSDISDVSTLLLEKSDGTYYLAIWKTSITGSPAPTLGSEKILNLSLKFGTALTSVNLIDITKGSNSVQDYAKPVTIPNLQLGDGPLIFKLAVAPNPEPSTSSSPTPTPTPSPKKTAPKSTPRPTPPVGTVLSPAHTEPTPPANATPPPSTPTPSPIPTKSFTPDKNILTPITGTASLWQALVSAARQTWDTLRNSFLSIF